MQKQPNIILIFSDQHRACDLGCYGNKQVKTENLDKLAKDGVLFTNAISNCPVCTPARGSLLTGYQPLKHKAIVNDLPIDFNLPSIASVFQKAGYETGYIGKWHLDGSPRDRFTPKERRLGYKYWAAYNCSHDYFNTKYYTENGELVETEGYEPEIQTELALDFIDENLTKPFLLTLSYGPPHDPYHKVPEKYKIMYDIKNIKVRDNFQCKRKHPELIKGELGKSNDDEITVADKLEAIANYWAHITALDDNIGKIISKIKDNDLYENTIIIYTSDHGDMLYSHGWERKQIFYSEAINIPMIFNWPNKFPKSYINDKTLFSLVDIAPTLYSLANIAGPDDLEGKDLSRDVLGENITQTEALIMDIVSLDAALWQNRDFYEWRGLKTEDYTYALTLEKGSFLFDDKKDPSQLNNLWLDPAYKDICNRLEKKLIYELEKIGDEFLPWQEHIRKLDLVDLWNKRAKEIKTLYKKQIPSIPENL